MKISTRLRYSSRLLVALAERGRVASTTELGRELGVSPLYLRPIALDLEKHGLIESLRGARGGYRLVQSPSSITMLDLAKIQENLNLVPCLRDPSVCPFSQTCKTRKLWLKLRKCIEEFLASISLEDVIKEEI